MNALSASRLFGLDPIVAAMYRAADGALGLRSISILLVSGLRTAAQQNALYASGRTLPGGVVTNARAGQSMHNYGLAFDCVPFLPDSTTELNWRSNTPQFQIMVAVMKEQGLAWGGDWKGDLGDFDHFQLARLPASPSQEMIADYAQVQPLGAIWANVAAGKYDAISV
jgi:peptidoglycan L-alanyl-D-glutamate endopeptidase CwlK